MIGLKVEVSKNGGMVMVSLDYLVTQDQGWRAIALEGPIVIPQNLAGIAFGSRVYGSPRNDSDYDVGVVIHEIPASVEVTRLEERLRCATALPVRVFWATPTGLVWKQTLDPIVFDLVHRGGLLWGSVEPWWREEAMSRDGVLDVLTTVDAMTDTGDWSDVSSGGCGMQSGCYGARLTPWDLIANHYRQTQIENYGGQRYESCISVWKRLRRRGSHEPSRAH